MAQFCPKCGQRCPDGVTVCPACGYSENAAPKKPAGNPDGFVNNMVEKLKAFLSDPQAAIKKLIPVAVGLVVVIVAVVILASVLGNTPKRTMNRYLDYITDEGEIEEILPESVWKNFEDKKAKKESYEEDIDFAKAALEEFYGKDFSFSVDIVDEDEMDDDDVRDVAKALNSMYDIPKKQVTAAYEIEYEVSIDGEDEDTAELDWTLVKIDGDWYLINEVGSFVRPGSFYKYFIDTDKEKYEEFTQEYYKNNSKDED